MFWVFLLGCQEIKGQTTIFSENFESTTWTIPSTLSPAWTSVGNGNNQWQMNSYTTGWGGPNSGGYSPTGANGTNQSARFHSSRVSSGSTGSLISPTLDFSAYSGQNKNLIFSMINTDGYDTINVIISIDGGNSWGSSLGTYQNYSDWTVININLGTIASSNVKIKFVATSDHGNSDIGIDEVTIKTGYFFNSPGQNTWTAPDCVTSATVECWGAGGAGASGTYNQAGAGGGGGAYAKSTISVIPGTVYIVNVGQGGAYNLYDIPGGNGSDTSFNYASSSISAKGGGGGGTGITVGVGGSATNSIGSTKFSGGNGGSGKSNNNYLRAGGGGGSSAGTSSNGQNGGSNNNTSNLGGIIIGGGNGGDGGYGNNSGQGKFGTIPGGGGGGGQNDYWAGGNGGNGQVVINWTIPNVTASGASSTPTLCINSTLTYITHTTTGATGISNSGVSGANGLPSGVSANWSSNTITISGTPTVSGTFNYSIPLTGGCGNGNATGTIIVKPINTITLSSATGTNLQTVCMNTSITNITYTTSGATGIGTPTNLPTGITATWASNTITISGTPTASGTFNYSIPITGGCGNVNATGTIMVNPLPVSTASNNGPYCLGSTIQLIGSSGLNYYSWNGPNNYSSSNQLVTQNFDSLGTGTTWTDNSTLSGWYLLRNGGTVTAISSGTGSNNTGAIYNFSNTTNSTDRALGSLVSGTYGVKITNTTGFTVTTVSITYTGEQYRDAGNNPPVAQSLTFDYSTNATNLTNTSGAWTPVPVLTFITPTYTSTVSMLDGNATPNRVVGITSTITGLSIPNGSNIWLRWTDLNDSNSDAAVAIDDVSIVLSAGNSSPSIINATTQMSGNYFLNVVDSNGCNSTATTNVVVNPIPNITISGNATICAGASTTLSATGANSYLWSNSLGTNSSINVTPSSNTQYTVTGTNSYNCTNNATINVTVNPNPSTTLIYHQ